jgi:hypothetical protein
MHTNICGFIAPQWDVFNSVEYRLPSFYDKQSCPWWVVAFQVLLSHESRIFLCGTWFRYYAYHHLRIHSSTMRQIHSNPKQMQVFDSVEYMLPSFYDKQSCPWWVVAFQVPSTVMQKGPFAIIPPLSLWHLHTSKKPLRSPVFHQSSVISGGRRPRRDTIAVSTLRLGLDIIMISPMLSEIVLWLIPMCTRCCVAFISFSKEK